MNKVPDRAMRLQSALAGIEMAWLTWLTAWGYVLFQSKEPDSPWPSRLEGVSRSARLADLG